MRTPQTTKSLGKIYLLPLFAIIATTACKKEPADYRSKYTGNWDFKVNKTVFDISVGSTSDSVTYNGKISYSGSDAIHIKYTPNDSVTLNMDEAGNLSAFPTANCAGQFNGTDKIHLYLSWGGLGAGTRHEMDGIKK